MKFPTFRSVTSSLSTILIGILLVTVHAAPSPQVPRKIDDSVNDKKAAFSSALNLADNELGPELKLEGTDKNKIYELRGQTYKAKSSHAVESYPLQTLLLRILTEVNDDAQREVDALKAAEAFVDSGTFRIGTDPAKPAIIMLKTSKKTGQSSSEILATMERKVPVKLWIVPNSNGIRYYEHWAIIIDGVHGFDVGVNPKATSDATAKTLPFVAATFPYDPLKNKKLIDLGCTATFKGGYKEMSKVFGELTNLKIEKKPYEEGGNCIDFTQDVLVHLAKDKKNIPDVPDKFKALRKERYDKVRAAVFKGLY